MPAFRILIVDYAATNGGLRSMLEQLGFTDIDHVPDVHAALSRMRERAFALVISEWRIGGTTGGLELLRRIRQDPTLKAVCFLLVASSAHPQLAETVRALGGDGFLMKPYSGEQLKAVIDEVLGSHRE